MADIAIFRINYKSDFILTLQSDAGWLTPFCIKFWTGAPSQAYFAGYDGTTYTHCAPVEGDPTKLSVQFDDHHLPIGDLKFQIGYHFTVADFPTSIEDEVINQAAVIIDNDGEQQQVMLDFNGETAPEIAFSLPAYANEAQRIANEQARIAAEEQRVSNEQQRISNEESRISAEESRQEHEQQRIHNEETRIAEFANLKADAIEATGAANDAATLANEKAQLAEDKAALAQSAATLASDKAQLAADKAALAQAAATLANDKAALAQQKADYAQAKGEYAQAQGDYAKAQGDIALADHERAEADHDTATDDHTTATSDHTQAESDHTRAEADHTTASSDHTQASSDHSTATSDHTQSGQDHARAESDHTTAAADHTRAESDHAAAAADHTRAESDHAAVEVYVDSLGAFDISAYHATGSVLAKYADLTAALGTNGANIPDELRKGGMSVKFVLSSDNNYVQYFLTKTEWSTNEADWEKLNLEEEVSQLSQKVNNSDVLNTQNITLDESNYLNIANGEWRTTGLNTDTSRVSFLFSAEGFNTLLLNVNTGFSARVMRWSGYPSSETFIDAEARFLSGEREIALTGECKYVTVSVVASPIRDITPLDIIGGITLTGVVETYPNKVYEISGRVQLPLLYDGKYVITNGAVGTVVELDRPQTNASYNSYMSQCVEGDKIYINGQGGVLPRLWAFLDKDYKIISNSANNANANGLELVAPASSKYVIVNDKTQSKSYLTHTSDITRIVSTINVVNDNIAQEKRRLDSLQSDVKWLDENAINVEIIQDSTYNTDSGNVLHYTGRSRTKRLLYDASKSFSFIPTSASYESLFWAGDTYQGYAANTAISPYTGTTHVAFCWTTIKTSAQYAKVLFRENVVDNLTTNSATEPLSAAQGVVLKGLIDNIPTTPGSITIEGSGVTKNAAAYGFLPNKTADENVIALQSCLDGGGLILIDFPGIYEVSKKLFVDSNTEIVCAPGVYFKRAVGEDGKTARHIFVNRGSLTRTYNENITIKGLNVIPNTAGVSGHSSDSVIVLGLRGLVAMFYVKNFTLDGFTVIDHTYNEYAIHLCAFDGAVLKNIRVETLKDGIHFGRGRNFVVEHCTFLTNDDALALNAVDYPESNAEAGWIEDGIIQDITFLAKPDGEGYADKRGVFILTGAWKDWQSGNTYKEYGDYCVNNGRLYQSKGTIGNSASNYIVSTVAPTHETGAQTYSDGMTWYVRQWNDVGYSAGVRRVKFKNMYFYRKVVPMFYFSSEISAYLRSFYPGSELYKNIDISFENIYNMGNATAFATIMNPCDRLTIKGCDFSGMLDELIKLSPVTGVPSDININLTAIGNYYENVPILNKTGGDYAATLNIIGSFRNGHAASFTGITPIIINNDLNP